MSSQMEKKVEKSFGNQAYNSQLILYVQDKKLPASIPCPICDAKSRRLYTRQVPTYVCTNHDDCGARTTLDASDVKRLGLK